MTVHDWLDFVFLPFMLLMPLGVALVVKQRPDGDAVRARRYMRLLVAVTAACLGLAAYLRFGTDVMNASRLWPLFFLLWFGMAMPLCAAKNPAWVKTRTTEPAVRSATLTNRRTEVPHPTGILVTMWLIWAFGVIAILIRLAMPLDRTESIRFAIATGLLLSNVWFPVFLPRILRKVGEEPEPLDEKGSEELRQAYEAHRNDKVIGLGFMSLILIGVMTAFLVLLGWVPTGSSAGRWIGFLGAFAGCGLGIGGAVFGVVMGRRRIRITEMLEELESAQGGSRPAGSPASPGADA